MDLVHALGSLTRYPRIGFNKCARRPEGEEKPPSALINPNSPSAISLPSAFTYFTRSTCDGPLSAEIHPMPSVLHRPPRLTVTVETTKDRHVERSETSGLYRHRSQILIAYALPYQHKKSYSPSSFFLVLFLSVKSVDNVISHDPAGYRVRSTRSRPSRATRRQTDPASFRRPRGTIDCCPLRTPMRHSGSFGPAGARDSWKDQLSRVNKE